MDASPVAPSPNLKWVRSASVKEVGSIRGSRPTPWKVHLTWVVNDIHTV